MTSVMSEEQENEQDIGHINRKEETMAAVPVYHSIDYEEKKIYIDIEEIKNEAMREIKKEYPDWDEDDFEVVEVT